MSRRPPPWFESWAAADAAFDLFVADLPLRREQLRWMVAESGGPELDGTVDSLTPLNEWYIETALRGEPDGMDWFPMWVKRPRQVRNPAFAGYVHPVSEEVMRLWELVAVYVGDVLMKNLPHARWVCFRATMHTALENGKPRIDVGNPHLPADAIRFANIAGIRVGSDSGLRYGSFAGVKVGELSSGVKRALERHADPYRSRKLEWQLAPTGPDAHRRTTKPTW